MALTRKHFRAAADILACHEQDIRSGKIGAFDTLVSDFARYFRAENSNFDADRFRAAVEGE